MGSSTKCRKDSWRDTYFSVFCDVDVNNSSESFDDIVQPRALFLEEKRDENFVPPTRQSKSRNNDCTSYFLNSNDRKVQNDDMASSIATDRYNLFFNNDRNFIKETEIDSNVDLYLNAKNSFNSPVTFRKIKTPSAPVKSKKKRFYQQN